MALPYPHGTASGQIGHGSQIDDNDTPGSTGGRFVGFGEDGLSKYNNRGLWALSENIDYIYQTYSRSKTVPGFATFTSDGADYYNLMSQVFVGLPSYPGTPGSDELVGLSMIFMVLDEKWGALQDIDAGGEVRVTSLRDTGNIGTIYKDGDTYGFHTNARLGFSLCDPFTGEPIPGYEEYAIPEGTVVNICYGASGSLETLPSDALLRTMIPRTGVPPGVILQNGTRKMLADLNMNGFDLNNVTQIDSGSNRLSFVDTNARGGAYLSEDTYGVDIYSDVPVGHTSILGQLNSHTKAIGHVLNNRVFSKQTTLTFNSVASTVTVPAGDTYSIKGEEFTVPDGNLTVSVPADNQTYYIAIGHHTGSAPVLIAIRSDQLTATLTQNMVIVALASHSSSFAGWLKKQDLRTAGKYLSGKFEVYVGSDIQCDFSDLQQAIDYIYANSLCLSAAGLSSWRPRIVVRNYTQIDYVAGHVTFPTSCPFSWEIVGEGQNYSGLNSNITGQAVIKGANDYTDYSMLLNDNVVHFRRIAFVPGGGASTGQKCMYRVGDGSTFEDCSITNVLYGLSFAAGIDQQAGASAAMYFKHCQFHGISATAVYTYGMCVLEDCFVDAVGGGSYALVAGGGASFKRSTFSISATIAGVLVGCDSTSSSREVSVEVSDCMLDRVALVIPSVTDAETGRFTIQRNMFKSYPTGSWSPVYVYNDAGSVSAVGTATGAQTFSIKDNVFEGCYKAIQFDFDHEESQNLCKVVIEGNAIRPAFGSTSPGNAGIQIVDAGSVTIVNNTIYACASGISVVGGNVVIKDNTVDNALIGISVGYSGGSIVSNRVSNCAVVGITASNGTSPLTIRDNLTLSMSILGIYVATQGVVTVASNRVLGTPAQGIQLVTVSSATVRDNWISYTTTASIDASACSDLRVEENTLQGCAAGYATIYLNNCINYRVTQNTIQNSTGGTPISGGGIYARRTLTGEASYGRICGNTVRYVLGEGPLTASIGLYAAIYFESSIDTATSMGKTHVSDNTVDFCGSSIAGTSAILAGIYGFGYAQVNNNIILNPQGPEFGINVYQYGIALYSDTGRQVWTGMTGATPAQASVVSGNSIIVYNANGTNGGICNEGTFYGIYMSQHGTVFGNTINSTYTIAGAVSSVRAPIFVEPGCRVAVDSNNMFGFGDMSNPQEGITLGNVGVGATDADLSLHTTGNSTGADVA